MRIQSDSLGQTAATQTGRPAELQRSDRVAGSQSQDFSNGYENVQLSDLTRNIGQAIGGIVGGNTARVQSLAAAYQNGRYHVDANQLSQKLIAASVSNASQVPGRV
ncbi:MAG: flagellar biosynthesis anti-sigma factor FlgM [Bryobacteraceae bacterium]